MGLGSSGSSGCLLVSDMFCQWSLLLRRRSKINSTPFPAWICVSVTILFQRRHLYGYLSVPGAQEFKQEFGKAMDHNEKLLAADEEEGESKGEDGAAAQKAADKDADESELASAVKSKATLDDGDKSSET